MNFSDIPILPKLEIVFILRDLLFQPHFRKVIVGSIWWGEEREGRRQNLYHDMLLILFYFLGLPDLVPNLQVFQRSLQFRPYVERRLLYYLTCAMEEGCLARSAYGKPSNNVRCDSNTLYVLVLVTVPSCSVVCMLACFSDMPICLLDVHLCTFTSMAEREREGEERERERGRERRESERDRQTDRQRYSGRGRVSEWVSKWVKEVGREEGERQTDRHTDTLIIMGRGVYAHD